MIKVSVRGIDQLKKFFSELTPAARKAAVKGASEYLVGNDSHGLRHYVSYKHVTRKSAYGRTFESDKQRRYVMAKIRSGEITPGRANRTNTLKRGWAYKLQGGGFGARVYNPVPYAHFVMGDEGQARQPAKVGWRKVMEVVSTNLNGMMKAANEAVNRWLKGRGMM